MQVILEDNEYAVIIVSDEAYFHLDRDVNGHNLRYWSSENPRIVHEKPLRSEPVAVWYATANGDTMKPFGIIVPNFFEDENGSTVKVNAERYCQMLNTFLSPEPRRYAVKLENIFFQQEGATAHTARVSM